MRALIVEDDLVSRLVLKQMLSHFFEIHSVVDGKEAVSAVRSNPEDNRYDLILMDIMMPEMDGLAALEEIRKWEHGKGLAHTPAIMVTALSDVGTVIEAFHDGLASGYLTKPINQEKLLQEISKLGLLTK